MGPSIFLLAQSKHGRYCSLARSHHRWAHHRFLHVPCLLIGQTIIPLQLDSAADQAVDPRHLFERDIDELREAEAKERLDLAVKG